MNSLSSERKSNNHACMVLAAFILLTPIFYDISMRWSMMFMFLAGLTFLDVLITMQKPIALTGVKLRFFAFAAVILFFYLAFSSRKDNETIGYMGILVLCTVLVVISSADFSQLEKIFYAMCAVAIFLAVYIIFAHFFYPVYSSIILRRLPEDIITYNNTLNKGGYGISIGGSIVYADYLMSTAGIAIFAILLHYLTGPGKVNVLRIMMIGILGVFLIAMFVEGRRGEPLCFILALGFMFICSFYKSGMSLKMKKTLMLILGFITLAVLVYMILRTGASSRIAQTIAHLTGSGSSSTDISTGRFGRWKVAIELFEKSPILGVGWGKYANYYLGDQENSVVSVLINYKYTHNDYLNVLCETGIIGAILLYVPLAVNFWLTFRQHRSLARKSRKFSVDKKLLVLNTFCLGSQAFWAALGMLDPVLYKQLFLCYFAFTTICLNTSLKAEKGINNENTQTA